MAYLSDAGLPRLSSSLI